MAKEALKTAVHETKPAPDKSPGLYEVSLPGAPTHLMEAESAELAFEEYKRMCGIVKTKAVPKIVPVPKAGTN